MSRIGNKPAPIPDGVKVNVDGCNIMVEGPKGQLTWEHPQLVSVSLDEGAKQVVVSRSSDERQARAFHGLTRALIANMIHGVKEGYEKRLEIVGVGYNFTVVNQTVQIRCGFANEIHKTIPKGLEVTAPDQTHLVVRGSDKQQVGQFAAEVRAVRKPEPYKGKGIRYQGEQVKIKPGKTAT